MDEVTTIDLLAAPPVETVALALSVEARAHPRFERPLHTNVREARLLNDAPWIRGLGKLTLDVTTDGWRFPMPPETMPSRPEVPPKPRLLAPEPEPAPKPDKAIRLKPPRDAVQLKERLLYLLQPPLEEHLLRPANHRAVPAVSVSTGRHRFSHAAPSRAARG